VNLRALGVEAMDGRLDGAWLRGLPRVQALKELKQLQGIGGFSAELVLLRGAGTRGVGGRPGT
jgi:DNA-3-methyladenine glycosylase II